MRPFSLIALLTVGCAQEPGPSEAALLALSPTELNNSYRDLLGFSSDPDDWPEAPEIAARLNPGLDGLSSIFGTTSAAPDPWPWAFPEEAGVDGFDGMADGQEATAYQVEELQKAAVHYASYALVSRAFWSCEDWESQDTETQWSCGWTSVKRFTERAWRRPLQDDEQDQLQELWAAQAGQGDLQEAVVITLAAVLQSPQFLFRLEAGAVDSRPADGTIPLTDWELASRLSYFLWDSMPDGALFAAAAAGELSTDAGLQEQTQRMLDHDRAGDTLVRFHARWLGADAVLGISPARSAYGPLYGLDPYPETDTTGDEDWPRALGPVRHSMAAEFDLFVRETLLSGGGTLTALLTSRDGWSSAVTKSIYGTLESRDGVDSVSWDYEGIAASTTYSGTLSMEPVRFPQGERAGILGLPAVLAVGSYAVHPAPILRGKTVLERLTCTEMGVPPVGAEGAAPPDIEEAEATNRTRTEQATSPAECVACHDVLNPPGFAFEHYDAIGRYRSEDNGLPVDASGSFSVSGEVFTFEDAIDLGAALAASTVVRDCYVLHQTRVATGEHLDTDDPRLAPLRSSFRTNDDVTSLLEDIVLSDFFRTLPVSEAQP
ncbi:MAG: DUF1592 domain-containing protein [Myxococcota bacterium]|nr:DUF1592 domain-containing protein [Myxococcota bacterium]